MNLYNAYETDPGIEREGVVLELGVLDSNGNPAGIRIRRAGGANVRFAKVFERVTKPHRRLMGVPGGMDPEVTNRLMREVFAEAVVVDFENLEDREGNPITYSKDAAIKLFEELPEVFALVMKESQDIALFKKAIREDEAKN